MGSRGDSTRTYSRWEGEGMSCISLLLEMPGLYRSLPMRTRLLAWSLTILTPCKRSQSGHVSVVYYADKKEKTNVKSNKKFSLIFSKIVCPCRALVVDYANMMSA